MVIRGVVHMVTVMVDVYFLPLVVHVLLAGVFDTAEPQDREV